MRSENHNLQNETHHVRAVASRAFDSDVPLSYRDRLRQRDGGRDDDRGIPLINIKAQNLHFSSSQSIRKCKKKV